MFKNYEARFTEHKTKHRTIGIDLKSSYFLLKLELLIFLSFHVLGVEFRPSASDPSALTAEPTPQLVFVFLEITNLI